MTKDRNAAKILAAVRRLLNEITERHPDVEEIAGEIEGLLLPLAPEASGEPPVQRRSGAGVRYRIEKLHNREVLYEIRPAGAPLRVDHEMFDALVSVIATAARALTYEEIAKGVHKAMKVELAEWQVRLLLRYLQRGKILVRERKRYRAVAAERFAAAAARYWRATARGS